MARPYYPSDERSRQRKAERRARYGQEPRPSGKKIPRPPMHLIDPMDYSHPLSDVRLGP